MEEKIIKKAKDNENAEKFRTELTEEEIRLINAGQDTEDKKIPKCLICVYRRITGCALEEFEYYPYGCINFKKIDK